MIARMADYEYHVIRIRAGNLPLSVYITSRFFNFSKTSNYCRGNSVLYFNKYLIPIVLIILMIQHLKI